jgi:long-chain acyl-CoA synthetase
MHRDPIVEAFDALRPEAPLVASPTRRATASDLADLARAAGSHLEEARVPPGSLVGLAAPDGPAFLASFLALRRRGLVPLLLEQRSPAAERERIGDALGSAWTFTCRRRWPRGAGDWQLAGRGPRSRPQPDTPLDPGTAAVKLTSGSTGRPRGIVTPAEALFADDAALARTMGLAPDERFLGAIPFSHSYGLSSVVLPALVRGSTIVMADEGSGPYGPLQAARALGATFFPTVPAFLRALLATERPPALPPSVRLTITAGAPLQPATATRFREVYGRAVHVFYGSSETGGICFDREGGAGERGSVGTPVEGVRVRLESMDGGDEADGAAGPDVGQVIVESAAVGAGYLPPDGDRLACGRFRTGDVAAWRGGELYLAGRTDDLINVRGKKVSPREVEAVVAGLPGVRDVVALGTDAAEPTLRVVVACGAGALTTGRVLDWCRERLAEHKVPRSVVLVDEIPRTSRGKVDRQAVLALRSRRPSHVLRSRLH